MVFEKMARNAKKKLAIFAGTSKCLIYKQNIVPLKCLENTMNALGASIVAVSVVACHLGYIFTTYGIIGYSSSSCSSYAPVVAGGIGIGYKEGTERLHRRYPPDLRTHVPRTLFEDRRRVRGRGLASLTTRRGTPFCCIGCGKASSVHVFRLLDSDAFTDRIVPAGPQRNGTVPAYNAIGNATTSAQYQNMSVMLNDANCPYYQLYGPPPSYETVIAQTRGKPSSPASPESTNARTNAQSPSIAPTSSYVPQCFSYTCNFSARLNDSLDHAARFASGGTGSQPREPREAIPFTHFPPYCAVTDGTVTQTCLPFVYQEPFVPRNGFDRAYRATPASYVPCPMEKSSEAPEASSANAERYTTVNVDCVAGSSGEQVVWRLNDCSNESTAHGGQSGEKNRMVSEATAAAGVPSLFKLEGQSHGSDSKSDLNSTEDSFSESTINRRVYGGSLKVTGRYAGKERCEEYSVQRPFSKLLPYSCDGLINTEPATARAVVDESRVASSLEDRANVSVNSFQSNPSNNVISACSVSDYASSSTGNVERLEQSRSRLANASTNSNLESKRRLDRSKSLD
ncbi:uncharacterized protein LOC108627932 isoform X2 [Ceratina calcarata]|uniref:Uncharacterized protein LOC108627932 isoform X2 n=1 Tax=Ceratina calcarata TaxID=156304 RepID=A0AAJ7NA16_9HYME|nr:uncharacterized protein LOC108627932 isoform X2 [Ceratina calcarata]